MITQKNYPVHFLAEDVNVVVYVLLMELKNDICMNHL